MFHFSQSKHINFARVWAMADSLADRIPQIKRRRKIRRIYKMLKYFLGLMIASFLLLLVLFSAKILSFIEFYDQAVSGQADLGEAIVFGKQNKFSDAMILARSAENNFKISINNLSRIKTDRLANQLPFISSQLNGLESLLVSAKFLSQAVYHGAAFGKNLEKLLADDKKLNFSKFGQIERRKILSKIFESAPELNGIKANLNLAYLNLDRINDYRLIFPLRDKIIQSKNQLNDIRRILEKAVPLSQLLPALAGYPEPARYLVLFENNGELRPTGGLLTSYGILQVRDGDITGFNTHDINYLDGPAQNKINIAAPEPIKKFLTDKWYFRDANWTPDWPTAAEKIAWFYRAESRFNPAAEKISEFNGVIALTPGFIADLLKIAGPVTVKNQVYAPANFFALFDHGEAKSLASNAPVKPNQEIIGDIVKDLKIKIFDLPIASWPQVINAIIDNLAKKNLLFYLADNQLENLVINNGWGGEIKDISGDYLMVVDANLGGEKTDAIMGRSLEYNVSQGANGLFSKLTLNYAQLGKADKETGAYKCYTRVYAPLGSELIKISGQKPSQIDVGNELGKTWFGFYLTVEPGKIKNVAIEYKLPALISSPKDYELYIQKQPGKNVDEIRVDLNFLNDIKSYNPASLYMLKVSPGRIKWEGDLNIDRSFEVSF